MPVYLPIAEISVNAGSIALLGVLVGFFSGLFGVGGGFLTTPFLIFFGISPSVAVATQTCQIVAASSAGVISQWQRRGIDMRMVTHMLGGGGVGAIVGLGIFHLLTYIGQIDLAISILYTILLGSIGLSMLTGIVTSYMFSQKHGKVHENRVHAWLKSLPYQTDYTTSSIRISMIGPMVLGFIGGILVTVLGAGGGFILVPAMIYFLGMPALMVTGTALAMQMVLAAFAALMHAMTTQNIDLVLAALLIAGSVIGAVLGLRATKYIRGMPARILLATLILLVALRMGYGLLLPPDMPFTVEMER